jgi:hypothetical protein
VKPSISSDQVSPHALAVGCNSAERSPSAALCRAQREKLRPPAAPIDNVIAYRVNDAVSVSGLSRATLYRLIKEGKLRSQIVAGRRLITPAALRELFSEAA